MQWYPPLQDPHGELKGKNVLIVRGSLEKTAVEFSLEVSRVKQLLKECREKLYDVRQGRPRPHRDDKILTAWNGEYCILTRHWFSVLRASICRAAEVWLIFFVDISTCIYLSPTCSARPHTCLLYFWGPASIKSVSVCMFVEYAGDT